VIDPRTASVLYSQTLPTLGEFSLSASDIAGLLARTSSNRPLLLTVQADGNTIAAKNIRVIRTPFIAQYDNSVLKDDDGDTSTFPTQASAYLMANQMTANVSYVDPLINRTRDPALFDGIMYVDFFDPNDFSGGSFSQSILDKKEQHSFQVMDNQGVLVGAEVVSSPYKGGWRPFPFDSTKAASPTLSSIAAQWFNTKTGTFDTYGSGNTAFVLDFANPTAVSWMVSGTFSYLQRLYGLGIEPALLSFSEDSLQSHNGTLPLPDTTQNDLRLPYYQSPTFSENAYQDFHTWLRSVNAPGDFVALPVLPQDYATAKTAGNQYLYRIQSAAGDSRLWWYWSIWRREIFTKGIGSVASQLKTIQATQPYHRAPLSVIQYQYPAWGPIDGVKFDPITNTNWNDGYLYDTSSATPNFFIDPGDDFLISSQQNPGTFDYYVYEVKSVDDATAISQAQQMISLKTLPGQSVAPKIGLHVDLEYPYTANSSNYMNTNMSQVFPNNDFKNPAFDMVWEWEAQCEYLMSMKVPDPGGQETLDVSQTPQGFVINNIGGYGDIEQNYASETGPYCLYRHQHYDLTGATQSVLRTNVKRLINWRKQYLLGQE
jgi:hypothetical protein